MSKKIDLMGKRFGRLVVIGEALSRKKGIRCRARWLCQCDCGKETVVLAESLYRGNTKSCGCYGREVRLATRTTHGLRSHPIYFTWNNMIKRCCNAKEKDYKYYGNKGIVICSEWRDTPKAFIKWAEKNGWRKGLQIDRIDNDKGYFPENCRFITATEQQLNTCLLQTNNTSGFRGVTWHKSNHKYIAGVRLYNKRYHLGSFVTAIEAARARDAFVIERGLHTPLNCPAGDGK